MVPVVKNPPSSAGDTGLIPGWGTKIPHATQPKKKKKMPRISSLPVIKIVSVDQCITLDWEGLSRNCMVRTWE